MEIVIIPQGVILIEETEEVEETADKNKSHDAIEANRSHNKQQSTHSADKGTKTMENQVRRGKRVRVPKKQWPEESTQSKSKKPCGIKDIVVQVRRRTNNN